MEAQEKFIHLNTYQKEILVINYLSLKIILVGAKQSELLNFHLKFFLLWQWLQLGYPQT